MSRLAIALVFAALLPAAATERWDDLAKHPPWLRLSSFWLTLQTPMFVSRQVRCLICENAIKKSRVESQLFLTDCFARR